MPLFKLSIRVADLDAGRSVSGLVGEAIVPEPLAVTLFEREAPAHVVEAYYAEAPVAADIDAAIAGLGVAAEPAVIETVPDENWVAISQAALPPIEAGRFVVHGSHDRARVGMRPTAIEIEAGEAFGTGHNATTSGCLEAIDRVARRRRFARVLDLGCGTGVLGIAAARVMPRAAVTAVDNDPIATEIALANTRLNRVAARVRVVTASGFSHALLRRAGSFELVLANILPRPLIALAPSMRRALQPGGVAVLSGILNHQAGEVRARYQALGFRLVEARRHAGWTVLVLERA